MLFCPDLGERLTTKALSDLLAKKVFGDQGFAKLLKARYDQMGELFKDASYDNPCWNLIEHGCKNCATANKRDARLKVPRGKIACNGNNGVARSIYAMTGSSRPYAASNATCLRSFTRQLCSSSSRPDL